MVPSAWAGQYFVLPDGEHKGKLIDLSRTPHLIEPLDALGPDAPDNEIAVMKSAQSGFTTMLQIVIGHSIDRDPCDMMVVQPTDSALTDFNSQKLGRAIEGSPVLKRKVRPQVARAGTASTTYEKKFAGGALFLALATSTADLRSKTVKKVFLDEVDEYEDDLNGQGDPLDMAEARQIDFLRSGSWKRAYISTPTIKGASNIEKKVLAGDQRRWTMTCPHCGDTDLLFDEESENFKYNPAPPYEAHYVAPCCGGVIEGWQKNAVYLTGRWVPTATGAYKSYFFGGLSAPAVPFDYVAAKLVTAAGDPTKQKTVRNLVLGKLYDIKGDATDHVLLMARREDYRMGHIPAGALLVTTAADVQLRGIYVEVLAHGPDQQSWPMFTDYLDGATTSVNEGAFVALTELYRREWPDAFGNRLRSDEFAIDAGYHTDVVYEWTRRHPGTKAVKGLDGWARVSLGVATDQDVNYGGRRVKGGAKLRGVGTWPLKSKFYEYLALQPIADGSSIIFPPGFCHFGQFLDEEYFKQITSEYLEDEVHRGRKHKVWKQRPGHPANHWFDCRVYNMAMASPYFTSFGAEDWAARAKERGIPADLRTPDLFTPKAFHAVAAKPVEGATEAAEAAAHDPYAALADLNRGL
jgi:phage terminase large subunit GpA-like protein